MLFIWSGRGGFVLLAIILDILLTALVGSSLGYEDGTTKILVLELIIAVIFFIPIWIYGKRWNSVSDTFIHKETGKEVVFKNKHTAFWIPMQYWAIIWPTIILVILLVSFKK